MNNDRKYTAALFGVCIVVTLVVSAAGCLSSPSTSSPQPESSTAPASAAVTKIATTTPTATPTPTRAPTATPPVVASITPAPTLARLSPTPAASTGPCNCYGPDLDCTDFTTQAQAQACYNYCKQVTGKDVFRLDADNDGIACESNR